MTSPDFPVYKVRQLFHTLEYLPKNINPALHLCLHVHGQGVGRTLVYIKLPLIIN